MDTSKKVKLVLQNGRTLEGWGFGYDGPCDGEVVFSTAMVGYTESLTDPSYSGQILCLTYPILGNYGIPAMEVDSYGIIKSFESEKIWIRGLVVTDYSENFSHWDAVQSLGDWMAAQKIPGICGVDTRLLTQILREEGTMLGKIVPADDDSPFDVPDPHQVNQAALVSCKEVIRYGQGDKIVVLVDCGVKHQILRNLVIRGVEVIRVPWDYDFNQLEWDGLFLSNGPGDPMHCQVTVEHIRKAMETGKPICGIDTRLLTQILREEGTMLGKIVPADDESPFEVADPAKENQVAKVSCKEIIRYGQGDKKVGWIWPAGRSGKAELCRA